MTVTRMLLILVVASLLIVACQPVMPEQVADAAPAPSADGADVEAKIASAMEAAPPVISGEATIVDWPAAPGEQPALLREGANEWLCLPDNPATPGPDPMCVDPVWTAWMNAYVTGTDPEVNTLGISYMLAGGRDASNVDPYAAQPAEGEDWVKTGAHIMLLRPGGWDPSEFTTDHLSGKPYIMWEGTPYEHLMVPVEAAMETLGTVATTDSVETKVRNVMGAVPQAIGDFATIIDWPSEPGGEMPVIREGQNEWVCVPDWPATPSNDPMCFDPVYMGWMAAFMGGTEPEPATLGVSYMLSGGEMADKSDPFAMVPPDGQDWVTPGPHVMLVAPEGFDVDVFGVDDESGKPWVAWANTPFQFLIIPIQ